MDLKQGPPDTARFSIFDEEETNLIAQRRLAKAYGKDRDRNALQAKLAKLNPDQAEATNRPCGTTDPVTDLLTPTTLHKQIE